MAFPDDDRLRPPPPAYVPRAIRRPRLGCETLETRVLLSGATTDPQPDLATRPAWFGPMNLVANPGHPDTTPAPSFGTSPALAPTSRDLPAWKVSFAELRGAIAADPRTLTDFRLDIPTLEQMQEHPIRMSPLADTRVESSFGLDARSPVYRVASDGTELPQPIRVDLILPQAPGGPPRHLFMRDGDGRLVGAFALPQDGGELIVDLTPQAAGIGSATASDLLMEITTDVLPKMSGSATSVGFGSFVLSVSRLDMGASAGAGGSTGLYTLPILNFSEPSVGQQVPGYDDATSVGDDPSVSLPSRSSGASAGIIGEENSPPTAAHKAAAIDLSMVDLVALEDAWPSRDSDLPEPDVFEVRGPNGFPLFGSALAMLSDDETGTTGAGDGVCGSVEAVALPVDSIRLPSDDEPEPTEGRRIPITFSISLAAAVAATLLLPDLAPRLDPEKPKRRLPWHGPSSRFGKP